MNAESKAESPFITPKAVEVWDASFRWRENGMLRDDTVDATWRRVASALAFAERDSAARKRFEYRLFDAFADWRLLLDERILAAAGTPLASWPGDDLVAVLNIAAFARTDAVSGSAIDLRALKDCTDLAVRALDNAIVLSNGATLGPQALRVGVIGFADALAVLGVDYAGGEARVQARQIAQTLAEGCLGASLALAGTRGAALRCDGSWLERARRRGTPADLIERAQRTGLRHRSLTAISAQPKLARFANDASDSLLPRAESQGAQREPRSKPAPPLPIPAQLELRGAMQPWIDEPIACPVRTQSLPTVANHLAWYARAEAFGLGALSWNY